MDGMKTLEEAKEDSRHAAAEFQRRFAAIITPEMQKILNKLHGDG